MARPSSKKKKNNKVRDGFVPVHVGEEGEEPKRYVIPISCLSSKKFKELLKEYEDHIQTMQEGPIKLPCSVDLFERVLDVVKDEDSGHALACFKINNGHW